MPRGGVRDSCFENSPVVNHVNNKHPIAHEIKCFDAIYSTKAGSSAVDKRIANDRINTSYPSPLEINSVTPSVECEDIAQSLNENSTQHNNALQDNYQQFISVDSYAPEFVHTILDIPNQITHQELFELNIKQFYSQSMIYDIMLSHKIIESGVPNRWGCRIPVRSNWQVDKFEEILTA